MKNPRIALTCGSIAVAMMCYSLLTHLGVFDLSALPEGEARRWLIWLSLVIAAPAHWLNAVIGYGYMFQFTARSHSELAADLTLFVFTVSLFWMGAATAVVFLLRRIRALARREPSAG